MNPFKRPVRWRVPVCIANAAALLLAACGGGGSASPPTPPPVVADLGVTVTNGFGPSNASPHSSVEVWASIDPRNEIVTGWSGATFTGDADEWHASVTVADVDVAVAAASQRIAVVFESVAYSTPTSVAKTARLHIPPAARGMIVFLHGTSGSSRFIEKAEARYVALRAIAQGYAVMAPEAEESQAGDLDGNGKERWFPQLSSTNVDLRALDSLLASLYSSGRLAPGTPLYALGMSNGGAMAVALGAVGASPVASSFPTLRFNAVMSYCAQGRADATVVTQTPTAWHLCANDDNPEVSNTDALATSTALGARGVPTVALLHRASPHYDERFTRVAGVSLAQSRALSAEFRTAGLLDANSFFIVPTGDISTRIAASPAAYPTFVALSGEQQQEVGDQIRVMRAEHAMYSDWAARSLRWFQRFP